MRELSLHILDIVENGLDAGASLVRVTIEEDHQGNWLRIRIADNGRGMPEDTLKQVLDPFFTTRKTRRVGLGFPLLEQAAKRCEGEFRIESEPGRGTEVLATFRLNHIDLAPLGDMAGTLKTLIMSHPEVDFVYTHAVHGDTFELDTRDIRHELEDVPINHPEVLGHIGKVIDDSLKELKSHTP